jgi:lysozyme family protein
MKGFEDSIEFVLNWETGFDLVNGGYTNDPDDPGGETKWGISQRGHPDIIIKSITKDHAESIYLHDYWGPGGKQKSAASLLKWPASFVQFDATVNIGNWNEKGYHFRANRILQKVVGATQDGIIGPQTLHKINHTDPIVLTTKLVMERENYYLNLARKKPLFNKYLSGWCNRTHALIIKAMEER